MFFCFLITDESGEQGPATKHAPPENFETWCSETPKEPLYKGKVSGEFREPNRKDKVTGFPSVSYAR